MSPALAPIEFSSIHQDLVFHQEAKVGRLDPSTDLASLESLPDRLAGESPPVETGGYEDSNLLKQVEGDGIYRCSRFREYVA